MLWQLQVKYIVVAIYLNVAFGRFLFLLCTSLEIKHEHKKNHFQLSRSWRGEVAAECKGNSYGFYFSTSKFSFPRFGNKKCSVKSRHSIRDASNLGGNGSDMIPRNSTIL